jgi:hypothetical protein
MLVKIIILVLRMDRLMVLVPGHGLVLRARGRRHCYFLGTCIGPVTL